MDPVSAAITGGFGLAGALGSTALAHWLQEDPEVPEAPPAPVLGFEKVGQQVMLPGSGMASAPAVDLPEVKDLSGMFPGYTPTPPPSFEVPRGVSQGYQRLLGMS